VPAGALLDAANNYLREAVREPFLPFRAGVVPAYAPRGGLGLFVRHGSASFRDVEVRLLEGPP
jgi:hypothetical protein